MIVERTSVGLDVHARSVVAAGLDAVTGEVFKQRLIPTSEVVVQWLRSLPGPVAVTYEAGRPGSGYAGRSQRPVSAAKWPHPRS